MKRLMLVLALTALLLPGCGMFIPKTWSGKAKAKDHGIEFYWSNAWGVRAPGIDADGKIKGRGPDNETDTK